MDTHVFSTYDFWSTMISIVRLKGTTLCKSNGNQQNVLHLPFVCAPSKCANQLPTYTKKFSFTALTHSFSALGRHPIQSQLYSALPKELNLWPQTRAASDVIRNIDQSFLDIHFGIHGTFPRYFISSSPTKRISSPVILSVNIRCIWYQWFWSDIVIGHMQKFQKYHSFWIDLMIPSLHHNWRILQAVVIK